MIRKLEVHRFKRFREATFELDNHLVVVGPNNCGKTTLLQAIALWVEAWHHWSRDASDWLHSCSGSDVRTTQGNYVATSLATIHSVAVTDFSHLWHGKDVNEPIVLVMHASKWTIGLELHFETSSTIAVRPADDVDARELRACGSAPFAVLSIPSTLRVEEKESVFEEDVLKARLSRGHGGSVLRNILLRISESKNKWSKLANEIHALFGYRLLPPSRGEPLSVFYRHSDEQNRLEIACAGSGFLQALLLNASLLYGEPQVVVIDEPDMHLHRLLQTQVYRRLSRLQGSQLIASSHSDVLVDAADPDHLRSLTATGLVRVRHGRHAKDVLRLLTNSQIHTAVAIERILYVEGETDIPILRAWAKTIDHPMSSFLAKPFSLFTSGQEKGFASKHYDALRTLVPSCRGIELRDRNRRNVREGGDGRSREKSRTPIRIYWRRYEIENYLLHPDAIIRFVDKRGSDEMKTRADRHMNKHWPPVLLGDPFSDSPLHETKGKDIVSKLMEDVGLSWSHKDCVEIAEEMTADEVHPEVRQKLDRIAEELEIAPTIG